MFKRPTTWMVISLLSLAGFVYFWKLGDRLTAERQAARRAQPAAAVAPHASPVTVSGSYAAATAPMVLLTRPEQAQAATPAKRDKLKYHLSNTPKTAQQLARDGHAVHLENALIDTRLPLALNIPAHLRAAGEPGSYVVQSRRAVDDTFREKLRAAGASLVSYIPNNAFLVRASAEAAQKLAADELTQSILPWEPYYKLKAELLEAAVKQSPMPEGLGLSLVLFADAAEATKEDLAKSGARVVSEEQTPFGPMVRVVPLREDWYALARLVGVQTLETWQPRISANDRSRVRTAVATDTVVGTNYLDLTGSNVLVALVDSGVDATHPDLTNRLFSNFPTSLLDSNGHGTHVAGIIAGSGVMSSNPTPVGAILNSLDFGSVTNATFRGQAPLANLYVLPAGLGFPRPGADTGGGSDTYLQESAAGTNALISNNSWYYANQDSYSIAASSYDAAVRDALPGVTGSQPVQFVFAAGNTGGGKDNGDEGQSGSIMAPGTAKNVITVGALELARNITNETIIDCVTTNMTVDGTNVAVTTCTTNTPWDGMTSSESEVAAFSSRGNVGIGVEGDFGRFKPDLVAPGTFVVSTRSAQWDEREYYNPTNHHVIVRTGQSVEGTNWHSYSVSVPNNAVGLDIWLPDTDRSTNLPIYVWQGSDYSSQRYDFVRTNYVTAPPDGGPDFGPVGTTWTWAVGNPRPISSTDSNSYTMIRDLITTNDLGNYFEVLSNLNNTISGDPDSAVPPHYYRFESGTSMSAAEVSGMLALMQEFFATRMNLTNSPALNKALLINGARSVGSGNYDFNVRNTRNFQGWGLPRLRSTIPGGVTNLVNHLPSSMWFVDQSPTNALATGQSQTRKVSLPLAGARNQPLRFTLVWTDPPGNPNAGIKLVNDLDLIVTNLDTGDVYFGNDIPSGSTLNFPWDTNAPPNLDSVNNVENIFLPASLNSSNYSVTVLARAVNVNAVNAHTNDVVQDYALVISSGDGQVVSGITFGSTDPIQTPDFRRITYVTNTFNDMDANGNLTAAGFLLDGQRAGANTPLLGTTNGMTNQWKFYVVTNTTSFSNAAFITFVPVELAVPRIGTREANVKNATRPSGDIDLYVSLNPDLTNLAPAAVDAATRSRTRGGTEQVVYSNSVQGNVYYIGIKSEDYMAAEFSFFGVFSLLPFGDEDGTVRCFNIPQVIPDRTPDSVQGVGNSARVVCPCVLEGEVRRVVVTNTITHEHLGDVIGVLDHPSDGSFPFAVLNNHRPPPLLPVAPGPYNYVYDDSGEGNVFPPEPYQLIPSDGPESLINFMGEPRVGPWILTFVDDSLTATGLVNSASLQIEKEDPTTNGPAFNLPPNSWRYDVYNVPVAATNLTFCVFGNTQPLELYIRRGARPTRTAYDKFLVVSAPGGCLSLSISDLPPLSPGRYYFGIYNPNDVSQDNLQRSITVEIDPRGVPPIQFAGGDGMELVDDAVANSAIYVTNNSRIASVEVGLRVDHPRVSDLALTLISPQGTRVLLMENRGRTNDAGIGTTIATTNVVPVNASGGPQAVTNFVDTGRTSGSLTVDYEFFQVPDQMTVYYDGSLIYDTTMVSGSGHFVVNYGPGVSTRVEFRMNEFGASSTNTAWNYVVSDVNVVHSYLTFTENTNLTTTPIKFLAPPFVTAPTNPSVLISGFEVAAGDYLAGNVFDGWTVVSNQVSVINDTNLAASGTRFLALASGQIARNLPTLMGHNYQLSYAFRGPDIVSWWRGERNAVDVVGGANGTIVGDPGFAAGAVGTGFRFTGSTLVNGGINIPNLAIHAFSNSMTIEGWMYVTNPPANAGMLVFRGGSNAGFDPYTLSVEPGGSTGILQFRISDPTDTGVAVQSAVPLTNWTHIAATLEDGTGALRLYTNGVLASQTTTALRPLGPLTGNDNPGVGIGNHSGRPGPWNYPFRGRIDELSFYRRAISASEVKAIYNAGAAGKFDAAVAAPANLAEARVTIGNLITNVVFGGNTAWQTNGSVFRAITDGTPLRIDGLQPGVLLDSITLSETGSSLFALPEESLSRLNGENAQGTWQLEVWDSRTGAVITNALQSWQLNFVFQNSTVPAHLVPGVPLTNSIPPGQIVYYIVDVPSVARFATNSLLTASLPLSLYFNQDFPPAYDATNAGDFKFVDQQTSGTRIMSEDPTLYPVPQLIPGRRYYLALENKQTVNVSYVLMVNFDLVSLPPFVRLIDGEPYCTTNSIPQSLDYYLFTVSTNASRAQFEVVNLSGDLTLFLRKGLPPTYAVFDYLSANVFTNDEIITVFDFSKPVPLTPGDWYFAAANLSPGPVSYCAQANEWFTYGTNIVITNSFISSNTFCLTWTSLPGVHYFVEGLTDLSSTNLSGTNWVSVSPTIVATDYATTYCVLLPTPFHFFRVREGITLSTYYPPPYILRIERAFGGYLLTWGGPPNAQYQVQWSPSIAPPVWSTFTRTVTSPTGLYQFLDDGSETGGLEGARYYRLIQLP